MGVTHHNVPSRPEPQGFHHVSVATGSRTIYVAGQTGTDAEGNVVEGGLAAQTERALLNLAEALETVGAAPVDVAKVTMYVVDWDPSMVEALFEGAARAGTQREFTQPATTLIGVKSLFVPEMLIEIEATAVVD